MSSPIDRRSRPLFLLMVLEMGAYGVTLAVFGAALPRVIREFSWSYLAAGMVLGRRIGAGWGRRVEVLGGLVLIGIGVKIVVEHLG